MAIWVLLTQEVDGVNQIVKGGANITVQENYTGVIVTEEVYARQANKLELVDGSRKFKVKDGVELLTLEQLNDVGALPQSNTPVINTPVEA